MAAVCRRFPPDYGGPGIALQRMAPHLAARGVDLVVLARRSSPPKLGATAGVGPAVERFGGGPGRLGDSSFVLGALGWIFRRRARLAAVQVFSSGWPTYLVPLLGRAVGVRTAFTMTLLDSDDPVGILGQRFGRLKLRLFALYDTLISINPAQAERARRVLARCPPLIAGSVGVDVDEFAPPTPEERASARGDLDLPVGTPVAAFVGGFRRRKGVERALRVWAEVAARRPDAVFVMLGSAARDGQPDTSDVPGMPHLVAAAGAGRVRLLASPPDASLVRRVLRAADVYLFPSTSEGTPTSVLEAMACGVPPVLAPLEGFTGPVVRDGVEGLVLEGDLAPGDCAERIVALLDDAPRRARMGRASRERVVGTHSTRVAVEAHLAAWGCR